MTTATIVATIDNYINGASATSNYGTLDHLDVGSLWAGSTKYLQARALGKFDLSGIPAGATINSAKLVQNIYHVETGSRAARVLRLTRSDWNETGSTWFNYKSGTAWGTSGADHHNNDHTHTDEVTFTFPASTGAFDITGMKTLVEDAIASRSGELHVLIHFDGELEGDGNDRYVWRTSEYGTAAERWRLVVDYTPAGGLPERSYPRGAGRGVLRGVA